MKQMIALWSMVMVHGLMAAGLVIKLELSRSWGLRMAEPPRAFGRDNSMQYMFSPVGWPVP